MKKQNKSSDKLLLHGRHAVYAALSNPQRIKQKLFLSSKQELTSLRQLNLLADTEVAITTSAELDRLANNNRHQGLVLDCQSLAGVSLEQLCQLLQPAQAQADVTDQASKISSSAQSSSKSSFPVSSQLSSLASSQSSSQLSSLASSSPKVAQRGKRLVIVDRIFDSRNLGAILRTCYLFAIDGVVFAKDNSARESAALAAAASGALDRIKICRVTNLHRSLRTLTTAGFWCVGLDSSRGTSKPALSSAQDICLIVGSEGAGIRPLTAKMCHEFVALPMPGKAVSDKFAPESYNMSVALALGLAILDW